MRQFFKFLFASMLGFMLSFVVLLILLVAIVSAIAVSGGDEKADISDNSVMHLSFDYPIKERTVKSPFEKFSFLGLDSKKTLGLNDILANIKNAKTDARIKGIYIDASSLSAGFATVEEIRYALLDFKKSGKFIISYSEVYTQGAYYLASVADKVYLNPEGLIDFRGFSSQISFFKGALDKLEIEAQVIKVGTYKSAVEPFILDKMSDPNRKQVTSFLGSLYDHFLNGVSVSRKVPKDSLFNIANNALVRNAKDAVKYKLADGLRYKDQVLDDLKSRTGIDRKKDLKSVSLEEYSSSSDNENTSDNKIAIVYASGEITGGEGDENSMGSERISRAIRKVRFDDKIKAVVLRINSPGGSALASDVIWREVVLTKKVKPVIVSMGDVAASGGYYIACGADSIYAEPNTITGSIGVFGIIPNMQKFFNNKLGITFDGVKTGKFADLGSINRPLTDFEKSLIQKEVNNIYANFTTKVAEGRKRTQPYIDSIGQGRVWSGKEAIGIGLVDKLGNINDAIKSASKKAKLKDYKIVEYPSQKDPFKSLLDQSSSDVKMYFAKQELGTNYLYYEQLKSALKFSGIQTRLPYDFIIN